MPLRPNPCRSPQLQQAMRPTRRRPENATRVCETRLKTFALAMCACGWLGLTACGADPKPPTSIGDAALIDTTQDAGVTIDGGADEASQTLALSCPVEAQLSHDLEHLDLALDIGDSAGLAKWRVAPVKADALVSFEVAGLNDVAVTSGQPWVVCADLLHVQLSASEASTQVMIQYKFTRQESMTGLMTAGSSVTWPTHCDNLFPCHSAPAEGFSYALKVTGAPAGDVVVHPVKVDQQVPSYAVALAHGAYSYHVVGKTESGLELGVWLKPGQLSKDAKHDVSALALWPKAVSWLEATLGPYPLGKKLAAVTVPWGPFAYGGLEMHPIYHMSDLAIGDLAVHCHEAAHGWFGNGVRIACWEDLVLSEGVADYLMVRAMAAAKGVQVMKPMFEAMEKSVASKAGTSKDVVVLQETCNEIDVEASGVSAKITYHKGALFLRAVAEQVGFEKLDAALGKFVQEHVGTAQRMTALLEVIQTHTGFDPKPLAEQWLRSKGNPLAP